MVGIIQFIRGISEQLFSLFIGPNNVAVMTDNQNGIRGKFERGPRTLPLSY